MAIKAIKNQEEDYDYSCEHICIEPYEAPWLAQTRVLRKKVEDLESILFSVRGRGHPIY